MNINDRFSAYYNYKVSVDMIYDNHPHKMQKRNQCLFLRIKISLIAHFNKPILVEFLLLFILISSVYWFFILKITW